MTPHEKALTKNAPEHVKKMYEVASKLRREKKRNEFKQAQERSNQADYKP